MKYRLAGVLFATALFLVLLALFSPRAAASDLTFALVVWREHPDGILHQTISTRGLTIGECLRQAEFQRHTPGVADATCERQTTCGGVTAPAIGLTIPPSGRRSVGSDYEY